MRPSSKTLLVQKTLVTVLAVLHFKMMVVGESLGQSNLLTVKSRGQAPNKTGMEFKKKRKVHFKVTLHLPSLDMTHALHDRNSPQYKDLAGSMSEDIQKLFSNTPGDQAVHNIQFSSHAGQREEPGNSSEPSAWQKETVLVAPTIQSKPSSLLSSSSSSPQIFSSKISKSQVGGKKRRKKLSTAPTTISAFSTKSLPAISSAKQFTSIATITEEYSPTSSGRNITANTERKIAASTETNRAAGTGRNRSGSKKRHGTTISVHTTTVMSSTTTPSKKVFDVALITKLFKECYIPSSHRSYFISLERYIEAYTNLLSIFKILGPVFSFAGDDAQEKLAKLQQLRKDDIALNQNNYITIQSMFEYENSPQGAIANKEGVSTNAWIHRVLKFVSGVIKAALDDQSQLSLSEKSRKLYTEILAPHHYWYMRAAAYLALLSMPSSDNLRDKLELTNSVEDKQALSDMASAIDAVYEDVEHLYVKYSAR